MLHIYRIQWPQSEQISGELSIHTSLAGPYSQLTGQGSPKMCSPWAVKVSRRVTPKGVRPFVTSMCHEEYTVNSLWLRYSIWYDTMHIYRIYRLGAEQATSHYLNQCWRNSAIHIFHINDYIPLQVITWTDNWLYTMHIYRTYSVFVNKMLPIYT